jgi:hypothetical protein
VQKKTPADRINLTAVWFAESFGAYAGESLHIPDDAALPDLVFLAVHHAKIFKK